MTGCRLVSLFNTQVKIKALHYKDSQHDPVESSSERAWSDGRDRSTGCDIDSDSGKDIDGELSYECASDSDMNWTYHSDDDLLNGTEKEEEEEEEEANNDIDWHVDNSGVTDDEYDTGKKETRTILWRACCLPRHPASSRRAAEYPHSEAHIASHQRRR